MILTDTRVIIAAKRPGTAPERAGDTTRAPDDDVAPAGEPSLDTLCQGVHTARSQVLTLRSGPGNSALLVCARHSLRVAIEDYVTTLRALQLPIPRALRQELLLYQRLNY